MSAKIVDRIINSLILSSTSSTKAFLITTKKTNKKVDNKTIFKQDDHLKFNSNEGQNNKLKYTTKDDNEKISHVKSSKNGSNKNIETTGERLNQHQNKIFANKLTSKIDMQRQ